MLRGIKSYPIRRLQFQSCHRIITSSRDISTTQHQTPSSTDVPPPLHVPKKEGDISSVFKSLSGGDPITILPPRFAALKKTFTSGKEEQLTASFHRLLNVLRVEVELIASKGSDVIPQIDFKDISSSQNSSANAQTFATELEKRGVAVVRGVVPSSQALQWKRDIQDYIKANPQTRAFPAHDPQVFELYWSPGQVAARAHPNMLETQKFLMSFWHANKPSSTKDTDALVSTAHPLAYADRLRIRQPGDMSFALGPHVDGGSVERWEPQGYGAGGVFNEILAGSWENFDPWEVTTRLKAVSDLYNGAGACSMFRMYQGWLAMSNTGAGEGTLLVNPMLKLASAYYLLRPFFQPINEDVTASAYLEPQNWVLENDPSPILHGGAMGSSQELCHALHPHLDLARTMVHVPRVAPGDYVAWHCDTIHAVDKSHAGKSDSSVLYIPACPLTEANVGYLARQKKTFLEGTPGPDFPGGEGEKNHVGRPTDKDIGNGEQGVEARRAMGLEQWNVSEAVTDGEKELLMRANKLLA